MAIHLNIKTTYNDKENNNAKLHWMPCVINKNGEAKVSTYFEPIIKKQNDDVAQSSFRGYPLQGKEIKVPQNYTGVVFQENRTNLGENAERNMYAINTFDKFFNWNWDSEPSINDKVITALDWVSIAKALHSPLKS